VPSPARSFVTVLLRSRPTMLAPSKVTPLGKQPNAERRGPVGRVPAKDRDPVSVELSVKRVLPKTAKVVTIAANDRLSVFSPCSVIQSPQPYGHRLSRRGHRDEMQKGPAFLHNGSSSKP
jgi:hypothetical protein